jgi:hypothetical protein
MMVVVGLLWHVGAVRVTRLTQQQQQVLLTPVATWLV